MANRILNYVGGDMLAGGDSFANYNPVDGSEICQVAQADSAMVDLAVAAARRASEDSWSDLPVTKRAAFLHAIADGIEHRFDDFLAAEIADTGKPLEQAKAIDIPRGIANLRFFADLAKNRGEESFQTITADNQRALNYTVNKPLGVVGVISPWNLPLLLLTWKLGPALACGNTVVAKPSEETPSTANLLAEVAADAGLPAGVLNVIHGHGTGSTGEFLASHPDLDAITFTGESATGSAIMRSAADSIKSLSFELGGKNPAIVFADADLNKAVMGTARSTFTNCGQVCLCSERVYVERPIFKAFVEALKDRAEALRIDRPYAQGTNMGPLISRHHRNKVMSYYQLAREEGAVVVTGGDIPHFGDDRDQGAFIQPTIWTGLEESSRCIQEEIFGPVCHITPFDSEEEVISMANNSRYGLAAALWTGDLQRAHRVAPRIQAGIVWVNTWFLRDLRTPFGGVKRSGIGREGGRHSLDFYSQPTNICIGE